MGSLEPQKFKRFECGLCASSLNSVKLSCMKLLVIIVHPGLPIQIFCKMTFHLSWVEPDAILVVIMWSRHTLDKVT